MSQLSKPNVAKKEAAVNLSEEEAYLQRLQNMVDEIPPEPSELCGPCENYEGTIVETSVHAPKDMAFVVVETTASSDEKLYPVGGRIYYPLWLLKAEDLGKKTAFQKLRPIANLLGAKDTRHLPKGWLSHLAGNTESSCFVGVKVKGSIRPDCYSDRHPTVQLRGQQKVREVDGEQIKRWLADLSKA